MDEFLDILRCCSIVPVRDSDGQVACVVPIGSIGIRVPVKIGLGVKEEIRGIRMLYEHVRDWKRIPDISNQSAEVHLEIRHQPHDVLRIAVAPVLRNPRMFCQIDVSWYSLSKADDRGLVRIRVR